MQKSAVTVVVGDKFSDFAALEGVMTVSKLANLLDGLVQADELPRQVVFGQGVSESWRTYLKNRVEEGEFPVEFIGERQISERTGRKFCHKWDRHNVLITDPRRTGLNEYSMLLSIDDACEIMSDHVTGHHVQGMVLIEAARQAFLAVTERFLLPKDEKYYFAINKFDTSYHKFAFPLPTEICFNLNEIDRRRDDRVSAKATVAFYQCGECVCEVAVEYTAVLQNRLLEKERKMALAALTSTLTKVMSPVTNQAMA